MTSTNPKQTENLFNMHKRASNLAACTNGTVGQLVKLNDGRFGLELLDKSGKVVSTFTEDCEIV